MLKMNVDKQLEKYVRNRLVELQNGTLAFKGKTHKIIGQNTVVLKRMLVILEDNQRMSKKLLLVKEEYEMLVNRLNICLQHNDLEELKECLLKLEDLHNVFVKIDADWHNTENEISQLEASICKMNVACTAVSSESNLLEGQDTHTKQTPLESIQDTTAKDLTKEEVKISDPQNKQVEASAKGADSQQHLSTMDKDYQEKICVQQEALVQVEEAIEKDPLKVDFEPNK